MAMKLMDGFRGLAVVLVSVAVLAGCAGAGTRTTETVTSYAIYDVIPGPETTAGQITEGVKTSLKKAMSSVNISSGIPPSPLPEKPGRFQLVNPFKNSPMAAMVGVSAMVPTCDGALMTATSHDSAMSSYGENTTFFLCLLPYTQGYHLDIYVAFSRQSGLFSLNTMAATMMRPLVGDSSQFIPRTIQSVIHSIEESGATTRLVSQYP